MITVRFGFPANLCLDGVNRKAFFRTSMSAAVVPQKCAAGFEELKPACRILILHEDFPAYAHALEVCRRLMQQFAGELDFNIKCWDFIELADPHCARRAAKTAGTADIILLSMNAPALPPVFDRWLDDCFTDRFKADGALALILNEPDNLPAALENLLARLKQLAGRIGMDFVPLLHDRDAAVMKFTPTQDWSATVMPLKISDYPQSDHWGLNE